MLKKHLDFFRNLHWQGCENCSLRDHRNNSRQKKFFELSTFLFHFQKTSERNVSVYWQKVFSGLCNCVLLVHRNVLRKNLFFFKSMKFYHFQTMWKSLAFSCRNRKICILLENLREIVLCFTRPLGILEEKHFSQMIISRQLRKLKKTFGFLPKFCRELCQNCILRVLRNILCTIFFLFSTEVIFWNIFNPWASKKTFDLLAQNSGCFRKMHSTCPKRFLKKSYEFLSVLDWKLKEKSTCYRFFLAVLSVLHFFVTLGTVLEQVAVFGEKVILEKSFDIEWNISGFVAYRFWLGCQKCILRAHVLKRFNFFNWLYFFNDFLHCVKVFCFLPQFHGQSCQNCILPVH